MSFESEGKFRWSVTLMIRPEGHGTFESRYPVPGYECTRVVSMDSPLGPALEALSNGAMIAFGEIPPGVVDLSRGESSPEKEVANAG